MAEEPINPEFLKREFERTGKTQSSLARALNLDPPQVSRMVNGRRRVQANEVPVIRRFFSGDDDDAEGREGAQIIPGQLLVGHTDFPVYSSAEGGAGSIIVDYEAVETVRRPYQLESVRGGYGLIVTGDSMVPACRPGDVLLMHPHLPPRPEDLVVLFRSYKSDTLATVKEYRGQTERQWKLRRYQPKELDFTLARDEWRQIHTSIGNYRRR